MTQTQTVEEPKAKAPKVQMDEYTYFVCIDDDYERKAAREYVNTKYPKSLAKFVHELRLDRLTDKHTVIALVRGNERTPAVQVIVNPQGVRTLSNTPVSELAAEVVESDAVSCAKHWSKLAGGEGELHLPAFLEELGRACVPAAIKNYPNTKTLKLGFA